MQLAVQKNDGLIIDILQDDHEFSDRERELFDIATITDSDIEAMNKEIDSCYKTNLAIGALNSVLKITELGFEVVVPLILDLESSELKDLI